MSNHQ